MKLLMGFNIFLGMILIGIIGFLCAIPIYLLALPLIQEYTHVQSMPLYAQSEKVFEDSAVIGGGSAKKSHYYWSSDPIDTLRQFYEVRSLTFISSQDDYGEWLIAGIQQTISPTTKIVTHESFCDDRDYSCRTVALIDAQQANFFRMAVMALNFRRQSEPSEIANLPPTGTLIVFTYTVIDF
jgi:hypothetical protein